MKMIPIYCSECGNQMGWQEEGYFIESGIYCGSYKLSYEEKEDEVCCENCKKCGTNNCADDNDLGCYVAR